MWSPTLPAEPPPIRWPHEDAWVYQQEAMAAADRRAEKIEQLHARCHEIRMAAAGALSSARWRRIHQRHEQRYAHDYHGYLVDSWGA